MNNGKEIITKLIAFLEVSINELSAKCGYERAQAFYDLQSGKTKRISANMANAIAKAFPVIDKEWLLTGEGEMLKGGEQSSEDIPAINNEKIGIPYYDIDVTASITESFSDAQEDVSYYIDYPPFRDCTAAFPVFGDSMEPDFYSGETILVKPISNINSMLWGEPYLVITNANCDNLRTVKNVYISKDRANFILRATNPKYAGDTVIPCEDVVKIFLVKGKFNRRQL